MTDTKPPVLCCWWWSPPPHPAFPWKWGLLVIGSPVFVLTFIRCISKPILYICQLQFHQEVYYSRSMWLFGSVQIWATGKACISFGPSLESFQDVAFKTLYLNPKYVHTEINYHLQVPLLGLETESMQSQCIWRSPPPPHPLLMEHGWQCTKITVPGIMVSGIYTECKSLNFWIHIYQVSHICDNGRI